MAKFLLEKSTAKGKSWKATGINPYTGRKLTMHGGQKNAHIGKYSRYGIAAFHARHEATAMTPKKYINKLRWNGKAAFGDMIVIPDNLFTPQ